MLVGLLIDFGWFVVLVSLGVVCFWFVLARWVVGMVAWFVPWLGLLAGCLLGVGVDMCEVKRFCGGRRGFFVCVGL